MCVLKYIYFSIWFLFSFLCILNNLMSSCVFWLLPEHVHATADCGQSWVEGGGVNLAAQAYLLSPGTATMLQQTH